MNATTDKSGRYGVCIDSKGYPASLEVGKLYPIVADRQAAKHGHLRVIDESGEEYGYSSVQFFILEVPSAPANTLSSLSQRAVRG